MSRPLRVFIGCESSGVVRRAMRALGHDAWSCDLMPSEDNSEFHYIGDVFDYLDGEWDLGIFHPPCTYMANSGSKHLYKGMKKENGKNLKRWRLMREGAQFFKALWESDIPKVAVENPVMLGYAQRIIGAKPSQVIQPYQFGHPEQKATCLWLRGLPNLVETNNVYDEMMLLPRNQRERVHMMPPGPDRWRERSRTFEGIGAAMALQWAGHASK